MKPVYDFPSWRHHCFEFTLFGQQEGIEAVKTCSSCLLFIWKYLERMSKTNNVGTKYGNTANQLLPACIQVLMCICSFLDRISEVRQPEYLPSEQVCAGFKFSSMSSLSIVLVYVIVYSLPKFFETIWLYENNINIIF